MTKRARLFLVLGVSGMMQLFNRFDVREAHGASQLMDYFSPTPIVGSLSSTAWGAAQVGPRDQSNGLEDKTLAKWVYWDGGIIKGPDGTYHMFSSRWDQGNGHSGWQCCSYAVHSTSKNLYGPYTDQGTFYTFDGGKGHNVTPFLMANGQYGLSISGVRPGHVFTADSLDGPWTDKGDIVVNSSSYGFCTQCNLKIMYRPDGQYEAIESEGKLALSNNVAGPYTVQGPSFYPQISSVTDISKLEDPSIWYSGGKYHWVTNQWDIKKAFHFTSADGMKNWKLDQGYAYDPTQNFIRYTDGTVNHWAHVERPEVYMENGHVVAFTFAAINVDKDQDLANDRNGSKVIVVPFDGVDFDSGGVPSGSGGMGGGGGVAGAAGSGGRGGVGGATSAGGAGGAGNAGGVSGQGGAGDRDGSAGGATSSGGSSGGSGGAHANGGGGGASAAGGGGAGGAGPVGGGGGAVSTGGASAGHGGSSNGGGSGSSGCSCATDGNGGRLADGLLLLFGLAVIWARGRRKV